MADGLGLFGWPWVPIAKGIFALDKLRYQIGFKNSLKARVPVVSIGNLSMGGAGKTPISRDLSFRFHEMGKRPVIVSRGYGRKDRADRWVEKESTFHNVGDEPLLLARSSHEPRVWVSQNRAKCAEIIGPEIADLILLDDGFQHWPLKRDVDIVLLDAQQGRPKPFPVGLFREGLSALQRAQVVIWTRVGPNFDLPSWAEEVHVPHQFAVHFKVETICDHRGVVERMDRLSGKKVYAFAGIAQPEKFFSQLEAYGLNLVGKMTLPDHGFIAAERVLRKAKQNDAEIILTTEKDYVKLENVPNTDILWAFAQLGVSWDRPGELDATLKRLVFGEA